MTRYFSQIKKYAQVSHISIVVYKKKNINKSCGKTTRIARAKRSKNLSIVKCNHKTSYENRFNVILADIWLHYTAR